MDKVLIANIQAGRLLTAWDDIKDVFCNCIGGNVNIQITQSPEDATRITHEALLSGAKEIFVIGGDGTINEVVNGFFEGDVNISPDSSLIILPFGSGNDTIRTLGIPKQIEKAIKNYQLSKPVLVDIGKISCRNSNGNETVRYFINIADAGIGSDVIRRVKMSSKVFGCQVAYLIAITQSFMNFKPLTLRFSIDGVEYKGGKTLAFVVANGRYFAGGLCPAPDAKIDDGIFHIAHFGDISVPAYLAKIFHLMKGKNIHHREVSYFQGKIIELDSDDDVFIEADGELIGKLPARFEILHNKIKVRV